MLGPTMKVAVHLAIKDLRLYARDKVGLALGFILPIALITVFALVFGGMGGGGGMPKPDLRVVDFDDTAESRALVAAFDEGTPASIKPWKVAPPADRDEVVARATKGETPLALVIGRGFGAALAAGTTPPLEIVRDRARALEGQLVEQALMQALMHAHGDRVGRMMARRRFEALGFGDSALKMMDGFLDAADVKAAESAPSAGGAAAVGGPGAAFGLKTTLTGGESVGGAVKERNRIGMIAQSVAGTAVMMLLFGLVACGTTLLGEVESGTLRRLLGSPVPRFAILLGKFLYCFAVGYAQMLVMFAFGRVAFGLPIERHLGGVLAFGAAIAAAATGFGVLLAVLGRSRKQVEGVSTLLILVMSALGGSWFPLFLMPPALQSFSKLTLNAWAMEGFLGLFWYDRSFSDLLLPFGVLLAVAVVLSAIAAFAFKRRFA